MIFVDSSECDQDSEAIAAVPKGQEFNPNTDLIKLDFDLTTTLLQVACEPVTKVAFQKDFVTIVQGDFSIKVGSCSLVFADFKVTNYRTMPKHHGA
jgi:hypothetical protein